MTAAAAPPAAAPNNHARTAPGAPGTAAGSKTHTRAAIHIGRRPRPPPAAAAPTSPGSATSSAVATPFQPAWALPPANGPGASEALPTGTGLPGLHSPHVPSTAAPMPFQPASAQVQAHTSMGRPNSQWLQAPSNAGAAQLHGSGDAQAGAVTAASLLHAAGNVPLTLRSPHGAIVMVQTPGVPMSAAARAEARAAHSAAQNNPAHGPDMELASLYARALGARSWSFEDPHVAPSTLLAAGKTVADSSATGATAAPPHAAPACAALGTPTKRSIPAAGDSTFGMPTTPPPIDLNPDSITQKPERADTQTRLDRGNKRHRYW